MRGSIGLLAVAAMGGCVASCGGGGGGDGGSAAPTNPPTLPPPVAASFSDVTAASAIDYEVGITPPPSDLASEVDDSTFGGAAAGDCDGDGDIDLFITYGDAGPNRLYLNQLVEQSNGLLFVDALASGGSLAYTRDADLEQPDRHSGPTFADMDGDGDLDLFLGGIFGDPNKIFANQGDCTFDDVTSLSPEIETMTARHTISAGFGDFDLDGDLDLFTTHWGTSDSIYAPGASEHLWENVSDEAGIRYVNVSDATHVTAELFSTRSTPDVLGRLQEYDYTFTATFARMDDDPWPDIAVASDFGSTLLLRNQSGQTFEQVSTDELSKAEFGMGSALGDYDHDGDLDWFVTSIYRNEDTFTPEDGRFFPGNRFFENREIAGSIEMVDATDRLNVEQGEWGWAACFLDIDNDGDLDIFHTNGYTNLEIYGKNFSADRSRVFVFDNGTYAEDAEAFGLDTSYSGRGAVCADFDNDGDVDILELTDKARPSGILWENRTAALGNNYLRVKLSGAAPNTEAAGARIYVTVNGVTQMREVMIGSNYTSQNPTVQLFGLGAAAVVDEVRVEWPAQAGFPEPIQPPDSVLTTVPANQTLAISQN